MEGEYGSKMIGKLKQMDILIIGLRGLGCETAKNLILAGPHSVVVHDDAPVQIAVRRRCPFPAILLIVSAGSWLQLLPV